MNIPFDWIEQFYSSWRISEITIDSQDHVYLTGTKVGYYGGSIIPPSSDAWVTRYDSSGNQVWLKIFDIGYQDHPTDLTVDSQNNLYLTGYTVPNRDGSYAWVAKYNSNGNQLWVEQLGSPDPALRTISNEVIIDSQENVYLTGYTRDDLGDTNFGYDDAWIAKYDSSGNQLWIEQFGSSGSELVYGTNIDDQDNIYLTGSTSGNLAGTNADFSDIWIAKYDSSGNQLWIEQFGSSGGDSVQGMIIDRQENIYLAGSTDGNLGGANAGNYDIWVAEYDSSGSQLWIRQFGSSADDFINGITVDSRDNVYLAGRTEGDLGGTNAGSHDAWVAEYDSNGNQVWIRQFGSSQLEFVNEITIDIRNNIYLTGRTEGDLGKTNAGFNDAWVAKYDSNGNQIWIEQFGSDSFDESNNITVNSQGDIYLTGNGNLGGQNSGNKDVWVAKLNDLGILNDPLFRFQNSDRPGTYLFAGEGESENIRANYPNFVEEGFAFNVSFEQQDDLIRFNRFQNRDKLGIYLYATEGESQSIRDNYPNFIEEGIAFSAYGADANQGVNYYRFQNTQQLGTYIFVGEEEKNNIIANFPQFRLEGVAFEVSA